MTLAEGDDPPVVVDRQSFSQTTQCVFCGFRHNRVHHIVNGHTVCTGCLFHHMGPIHAAVLFRKIDQAFTDRVHGRKVASVERAEDV